MARHRGARGAGGTARRLIGVVAVASKHPENVAISYTQRARLESVHAIRIAPPEVAQRIGVGAPAFGGHALFSFQHVMAPAELQAFIATRPDGFDVGSGARDPHVC